MSQETVNQAHYDSSGASSAMGVIGTLGTADVGGTAHLLPMSVHPDTGAQYVYNLAPAGSVSIDGVNPSQGTLNTLGTVGVLQAGTVAVNMLSGTLNVGTTDVFPASPDAAEYLPVRLTDGTSFYTASGGAGGGTVVQVNNGSIVVTAGTVETTLGDLQGGTIDALTTGSISDLAMIHAGTISSVGTLPGVGTISNVGSITNIGMLHGGTVVTTMGDLSGGTINLIEAGTITVSNPTGTTVTVDHGSVVVTAGTIETTLGDLTGGTVDLITRVSTIGTLEVGTISSLPSIPAGNNNIGDVDVATLPNIPGGTINLIEAGTISVTATNLSTNIGQVAGINAVAGNDNTDAVNASATANKLYVLTRNTVFNGTNWDRMRGDSSNGVDVDVTQLPNVPGGTLNSVARIGSIDAGFINQVFTVSNLANGTIQNSGTVTGVGVVSALTSGTVSVNTPGTVTSGSIAVTAGTIASVGTVPGVGVVTSIANLAGGTVQVNPKPTKQISTIGSIWGTTSGTAGTLVAAPGVGTSIYVNDLSIVNEGTTNLTAIVGYGTAQQGTTVLKRAAMPGNGGIQASFPVPVSGNITNLPIVISTTGSGTAAFNLTYWIE